MRLNYFVISADNRRAASTTVKRDAQRIRRSNPGSRVLTLPRNYGGDEYGYDIPTILQIADPL